MDIFTKHLHDEEIISLFFDRKKKLLVLKTNKSILDFFEVDFFDFSPFEVQNVIMDTYIYNIKEVPDFIISDYKWIRRYFESPNVKVFSIDSSVGMQGIIIFKEVHCTALSYMDR